MHRQNITVAKEKESLKLLPVLTFSEELTIDTPYGDIVIDSALPGIWQTSVIESTGPFGETSENISLIHESLERDMKVPLYLEEIKQTEKEIIYLFAHKNAEQLVDFYRIIVVEKTRVLN